MTPPLHRSSPTLDPSPTLTVSIIICCWTAERGDLLRRAIATAADQSGPRDGVIVVVDHNEDLKRDIERWVATELPHPTSRRVDVTANRGPRGLSGARNTGVDRAQGDILAFLDDDAVPRAGWLAHLRSAFIDPTVAGVGGGIVADWAEGQPGWFPEELRWVVGCDYRGLPEDGAEIRNPIGANMALRRSALADRRFDTGLGRDGTRPAGGEETELAIRIRQDIPTARFVRRAAAEVDHHVTADRHRFGYLVRRCWHEGLSKGAMTARVGTGDGLAAERGFLRTIPKAALRHLGAVGHGDRWAPARAAALLLGTGATGLGYLRGRRRAVPAVPRSDVTATSSVAGPDADPSTVRPSDPPLASFVPIPVVEVERADSITGSTVRPNAQGRVHLRLMDRGWPVAAATLEDLPTDDPSRCARRIREWSAAQPNPVPADWPSSLDVAVPPVSVIVCTLGRTDDLLRTLHALLTQDHPAVEIIVVDNAPSSGRVRRLVDRLGEDAGRCTVVAELRPGLSHARNAGVRAAHHDLIAFTDDDAVPSPHWLRALVAPFAADAAVGCVTGPVLPSSLDTEPQWWFEQAAGFGKGFAAMHWGDTPPSSALAPHVTPGHRGVAFPFTGTDFGSGNNMAFRRAILEAVGPFDPALGAGSPTMGGEDLDMFRRVFMAGHSIVYSPPALVTHTHRETAAALRSQMYGYGLGMAAVMLKQMTSRDLVRLMRRVPASVRYLLSRDSEKNVEKRPDFPSEMTRAELRGYLAAAVVYPRARWATRQERRTA